MLKMNAVTISIIFCLTVGNLVDAGARVGAPYSITVDQRDINEASLLSREEERSIDIAEDDEENLERRAAQNQQEQRVFDLTNAARVQGRYCGSQWYPAVQKLAWNDKLADAARRHAYDMRDQNYFSHTSKDGRTPTDRIVNAGYKNWCANGENLAGNSNADSTVQSWINSPGHCANIMSGNFRDIGIGYAPGGPYDAYWVQNFAKTC